MNKIVENLYLGDLVDAQNYYKLKHNVRINPTSYIYIDPYL